MRNKFIAVVCIAILVMTVNVQSANAVPLQQTLKTLQERIEAVKLNADLEIERRRIEREIKQSHMDDMVSRGSIRGGFLNMDVRTPSGLEAEHLEEVLKSTGLKNLGKYFIQAENEYNVNAIVLASLAAHESGWGNSKLAKERNNLFGYKAYDHDINKAMYFKTREDAIMTVAKALSVEYLSENGKHFNGYTLTDINKKYASDKQWCIKVADIARKISSELR